MRRIITIVALAATMLLGTTATALAFVPPGGGAADIFAIDGECNATNLLDSFPGAKGQWKAIGEGFENHLRTVGAWNATSDEFSNSQGKSQIGLCE
jgi:hypothetical protein